MFEMLAIKSLRTEMHQSNRELFLVPSPMCIIRPTKSSTKLQDFFLFLGGG